MHKRIFFRVHGDVQGVGFRYYTRKRAVEYGLTGWVKNTSNGKVEGEAQGEESELKKLLKDVDNGPPHSHVVKVEKNEIDLVEGESSFEVTR
ncbi:acylphosphatase [Xylogone sp. PMI_703]|nr:acylphosphatase [Xylogone sp. PMI_703]